mgnify:CR=1 FL=1
MYRRIRLIPCQCLRPGFVWYREWKNVENCMSGRVILVKWLRAPSTFRYGTFFIVSISPYISLVLYLSIYRALSNYIYVALYMSLYLSLFTRYGGSPLFRLYLFLFLFLRIFLSTFFCRLFSLSEFIYLLPFFGVFAI